MNALWTLHRIQSGATILPAAERSRMERIGDAMSDFARDDGLRIILIALGTVIVVRVVRLVLRPGPAEAGEVAAGGTGGG